MTAKKLTSKTDGFAKNCLRWNATNDDLIIVIYFADEWTVIHVFVTH